MKISRSILALAVIATVPVHAGDSMLADARRVAGAVPGKLLTVLTGAVERSGPQGAIAVCRERAPQLAREASTETGWAIRRVSLRTRNPGAVPDEWERLALEEFDRRAAAGEDPRTLEKSAIAMDGVLRVYRYMKALPTAPLCLGCHGEATTLAPAVRESLRTHYPEDRAVGYRVGEIRGAITLKKPL